VGHREYPLPKRHIRQDRINQMRGPGGHSTATATRAEAAPLARERDEPLCPAGAAAKPCEPARQPATAQERSKLVLDEPRHAFAVRVYQDWRGL